MADGIDALLSPDQKPPQSGLDVLLAANDVPVAPEVKPTLTQTPARLNAIGAPNFIERQLAKLPDILTPKQESLYRGFVMGAADPSVAAYQVLSNAIGNGQPVNSAIANKEQQYQDARANAGREGVDWTRLGGNIATSLPLTASLPVATGLADSAIQGAGVGAGTALLSPVTQGDYIDQKARQVGAGATGGALFGPLATAVGNTGNTLTSKAEDLMQSALKPTIEQLRSGKAATAVRTLLDEGINATQGGVGALKAKIADIDNQITQRIANSNATVDKQAIIGALGDTRNRFMNQVNPVSDLGAIDTVEQGFLNHPNIPNNIFPVQQAQALKQGTYGILAKKYGQLGSAETEAQKGLARGLKEQISAAVPEVGNLNAQESKLIDALSVTERRALMDANKNPLGLAALAHDPAGFVAFMADKSALFKSLLARSLNKTANAPVPGGAALAQALRQNSANVALPAGIAAQSLVNAP